jgi:hypothetical protein
MPESLYQLDPSFLALPFEWSTILNFLLGMITGFVLLSMTIAFLLISARRNRNKIIRSDSEPLQAEEIEMMIQAKQVELNDTVKVADNAYFRVAFDLSIDLMYDIAKYYFPDSKYPIYELSIQEILDLNVYITARLQKLVNGKIIRVIKNSRIATIVDILNKKKAIDNSKIMKWNRQFKVSKVLSYGAMALNYANPVYWFRKLALKPSTTLVTKEVCKLIIRVVGEETNIVYSKNFFKKDEPIERVESQIDKIITGEILD